MTRRIHRTCCPWASHGKALQWSRLPLPLGRQRDGAGVAV